MDGEAVGVEVTGRRALQQAVIYWLTLWCLDMFANECQCLRDEKGMIISR